MKKRNTEESRYNANGTIRNREIYKYDTKSKLVNIEEYDPVAHPELKTLYYQFSYDKYENLVEKAGYNAQNLLYVKWLYLIKYHE